MIWESSAQFTDSRWESLKVSDGLKTLLRYYLVLKLRATVLNILSKMSSGEMDNNRMV